MIPLAIIGAGRVTLAAHLPVLLRMPEEFRVVAVIDGDKRRAGIAAAMLGGAETGADPEIAIDAGARAVLCATPWYTHAEIVTWALENGLEVLCEKPLTLDRGELDRIRRLERSRSGRVAVGYMKRHDLATREFIDRARRQRDGLRYVRVHVIDPNAPHQIEPLLPPGIDYRRGPEPESVRRTLDRVLGEGVPEDVRTAFAHPLGGSLVHQINILHRILGTDALLGHLSHAVRWAGGRSVACGWTPGPGLHVHAGYVRAPQSRSYIEEIECVGETERLVLRLPSPYARERGGVLEVHGHRDEFVVGRYQHAPEGGTGFARQLRAWADALDGGHGEPLPGTAEADLDLRVVEAAALAMVANRQGAQHA